MTRQYWLENIIEKVYFASMSQWEKPVYKRLAASELGAGHTSGIVPTVETQPYFGTPQKAESHLIKKIFIEFWIGKKSKIITTNVNYFKSDTHDHIHLTGNLLPTYKAGGASVGDILVFWKSIEDENSFKAELIKLGSARWKMIEGQGLPSAGGFIELSPPGKDSELADTDEETDDYEILSEVEETLTPADFPTVNRRGRIKQGSRMITVRNKAKGDFVLKQQNYKCQVDGSHRSFLTPAEVPYMEKHHLISMRFYEEFDKDLDDINNIVSMCPTCHKHIHLGKKEEIGNILKILYKKQKDALQNAGFVISLEDLKGKYGVI
ncbi:HNH endonuclease [Candidatus Woesearchaeota archaeon]|nr:HNH endonuclease [Candidatus Woesearchaeota archaeon]